MSHAMNHCRSLLLAALTLAAGATAWVAAPAAGAQAAEPAVAPATDSRPANDAASAQDAATQQPAAAKAAHASAPRHRQPDARTSAAAKLPVSATARSSGKPTDRLDLDPSVVTGNRELPKVMYIVPWKKAEPGDLPAQPFNTLLDEALTPVDRDVFRREVTYYGAVSAAANSADDNSPPVAQRPEK